MPLMEKSKKNLLKGKEELNKWKIILMDKFKIIKMSILSKSGHNFNKTPQFWVYI